MIQNSLRLRSELFIIQLFHLFPRKGMSAWL